MIKHQQMKVYTGTYTTATKAETVATSSTNSYYTEPVAVGGCQSFAFQVEWTNNSAMVGVFYIDVSNDPRVHEKPDSAVWTTTAEVMPANPASNSSNTAQTFSNSGYAYVRLKYTNTSGTGTFGKVWVNANK